jgi:hypothetical protein
VRSTAVYLFAQDSWKIRPNVTLNYGLRWEMNTPMTDIGQKVQTYRPGQVSNIYPCSLDPSNPLYATYGGGTAGCDAAGNLQIRAPALLGPHIASPIYVA